MENSEFIPNNPVVISASFTEGPRPGTTAVAASVVGSARGRRVDISVSTVLENAGQLTLTQTQDLLLELIREAASTK